MIMLFFNVKHSLFRFWFTIIISLFVICISTNFIVTMNPVFLLKLPKFLEITILPSFLTVW